MTQTASSYINTLIVKQLVWTAQSKLSPFLNTISVQPRAILFPSNWLSCDLAINGGTIMDDAIISGNLSDYFGSVISIPTVANQLLPLVPGVCDFLTQIQLSCSVAQAGDTTVTLFMQPMYESGYHN